jgi:hypothetical protein
MARFHFFLAQIIENKQKEKAATFVTGKCSGKFASRWLQK